MKSPFPPRKIATALFFCGIVLLIAVSIGCKSRNGAQPTNPFASDRQTVPPPGTYSYGGTYLGQQPGASGYAPQAPATVYPSGTQQPSPIPANAPLPSGSGVGGYGSIGNGGGATLFQTSAQISTTRPVPLPVLAEPHGLVASSADRQPSSTEIPSAYTMETAFQNLESRQRTVTRVGEDGKIRTTYADPAALVVSSAQMVTKVEESGE